MEKLQDKECIRLSEYFLLPPRKSWDKHCQEFERLVKYDRFAKKFISDIRQIGKINLKVVKNMVKKCSRIAQRAERFNSKFRNNWRKLENYANAKIDIKYVRAILKFSDRPFIWEESLVWYILTNEIRPLSIRCRSRLDEDRNLVILEISPEATFNDIRNEWFGKKWLLKIPGKKNKWYVQKGNIPNFQEQLIGFSLKNKHTIDAIKFRQQIKIAKDTTTYQKKRRRPTKEYDYTTGKSMTIGVNELKARDKYELVEKYNPEAVDDKNKQKKEEARQRQIHRRHKKYL